MFRLIGWVTIDDFAVSRSNPSQGNTEHVTVAGFHRLAIPSAVRPIDFRVATSAVRMTFDVVARYSTIEELLSGGCLEIDMVSVDEVMVD